MPQCLPVLVKHQKEVPLQMTSIDHDQPYSTRLTELFPDPRNQAGFKTWYERGLFVNVCNPGGL
jgi:hypothetical protein